MADEPAPEPADSTGEASEETSRSGPPIVLIAIAAVVLANVVGVIMWLVVSGDDKPKEPPKKVVGTIPEGGRSAGIFNGRDLVGWACVGDWQVRNGVIATIATRTTKQIYTFAKGSEGAQRLRDFHLSFVFKVRSGRLRTVVRMLNPPATEKQRMISFGGSWADRDSWYRAHLVVTDDKVRSWVEGAAEAMSEVDVASREGALAFVARPGDDIKLRDIKLTVYKDGTADASAPFVLPLVGKKSALFNGKDDDGWEGEGLSGWRFEGGTIQARTPDGADRSFGICGEKAWKNYRLRFEIRNIVGEVQAMLRFAAGANTPFQMDPKVLGERDRWYKVVLTVRDETVFTWVEDTREAWTFDPNTKAGRVGFLLGKGASCEMRNLEVDVAE